MSATVHTHPSCPAGEIFAIRRAAALAGARYIPSRPNFAFTTGHVDYLNEQSRARRFSVIDKPAPFDPNDGGHAA